MIKFKDLKLKYKFIIVFLICLLSISLIIFTQYCVNKKYRNNYEKINSANMTSIITLNSMSKNILTLKNVFMQLTFNGADVDKLDMYNSTSDIMQKNNELMKSYKSSSKFDGILYGSIEDNYNSLTFYEKDIENKIDSGKHEEAVNEYSNLSRLTDELGSQIDELVQTDIQNVKDNNLKYVENYKRINSYYFILISLIILGIVLFHLNLIKKILQNLNKQMEFTKEMAIGRFDDKACSDSKKEFGAFNKLLNKVSLNTKNLMNELSKSKDLLKQSEERCRLAIEATNDGIWDVDLIKNTIYISNKCKDILGIQTESNIFELSTWNDKFGKYELFDMNTPDIYKKFIINSKQDSKKIIVSKGRILYDKSGVKYRIIGSINDVTDERKADEIVKYIAYNDKLTGLLNRTSFNEDMELILKNIGKKKHGVLFLINIDNFKNINEIYGHEIGDSVISKVSIRLKNAVDYNDNIYYMGGDNFSIFSIRIKSEKDIDEYIEKIIFIFKKPFVIGSCVIYISSSIGISVYPDDGRDASSLLKNADMALTHAKAEEKNSYMIYNQSMKDEALNKMLLQNDLKDAVENKQFMLYYQPQYDINTYELKGMEALVRWYHPKKGVIMPGQFINAAEETGLIIDIGKFVLKEACRQDKEWQDKGYKPFKIAVNVSVEQLEKENFIDVLKEVLNETGLSPVWLELEVTESGIIKNFEASIKKLYKIRELGISVALDDFGTGYSSLNYLISLPIGTIKIDKSFVDNITKNSKDQFVAHSLIKMAQGIGLNVIAEGVETVDQLKILKDYNCNIIQGYYFSKPVCSKEAEKLLGRTEDHQYK